MEFYEGMQLTYPRRVSHEVDIKEEPLEEESQPFPRLEESYTYVKQEPLEEENQPFPQLEESHAYVKQEPLEEESQPFPQLEESYTYSIPMEYVCVMCRQRPVNCIFHPCAHLACTFCASQNDNCICACAIKTVTRFTFQ